jgi:hypothetical protein
MLKVERSACPPLRTVGKVPLIVELTGLFVYSNALAVYLTDGP